jgi:hypothetical protein
MTLPSNDQVTLQTVQRPAEIVNYRSMGTTRSSAWRWRSARRVPSG